MAGKDVGDRIGPYQLVAVLGTGGAGKVFRAAWKPTEGEAEESPPDHPPEVALKLLRPEHAANEAIFNRFVREIGVAQAIDHPHILRHVDSGLAEDYLFYAMEIAPYGSLQEVLRRRNSLPWRDAVEGAIHVAAALGALHDRGVVHRDLKPGNIFLADDGALKLGDFGLALKDDAERLTISGQTVGSVRYMAPEQVRGRRDIDGRADLYALGCVLFESVAGRGPFTGSDAIEFFRQHVNEPPPKLRSVAPTAPASLEDLVDRLLAKDRDDRPPTAQAVVEALQAILSAPDGEVDNLADSLTGAPAAIEPLPSLDDSDAEFDAASPHDEEPYSGDDADNDTAPPTASPTPPAYVAPAGDASLSRRLAEGGPERKGCAGLLLVVTVGLGTLLVLVWAG
ncbi:serine/threonine-protein kinase [Botrimarina sp.]|uniref:serine/threonine-protein kinase n=1 Tax=Botrimarina sp. TaxID=2795802 RepID=UPI0032EDE79F